LMKSNFFLSFMDCSFDNRPKKPLLNSRSQRFSSL
jgi:hypothetical protein